MVQDILSGFGAGVFGTCLNCWTDVVRSVIQKEAINATFNPEAKAPPMVQHLNIFHFLGKTAEIANAKGIGGLYAGFPVKCLHLGGSGAILAVLVPRFKEMYGVGDK